MEVNFEVFRLQLNATSLERVTHDVAVNEFRKAEESVWLLLEKNAEARLLVSFLFYEPSHHPSKATNKVLVQGLQSVCVGGGGGD